MYKLSEKFNLLEKFELSEKFNLSEKYRLVEEITFSEVDTQLKALAYFAQSLTQLVVFNYGNSELLAPLTQLNTEFTKAAELNAPYNELKQIASNYLAGVDKIFAADPRSTDSTTAAINKLKNVINLRYLNTAIDDAVARKNLVDAFAAAHTEITTLYKTFNQAIDAKSVEEIKNLASAILNTLELNFGLNNLKAAEKDKIFNIINDLLIQPDQTAKTGQTPPARPSLVQNINRFITRLKKYYWLTTVDNKDEAHINLSVFKDPAVIKNIIEHIVVALSDTNTFINKLSEMVKEAQQQIAREDSVDARDENGKAVDWLQKYKLCRTQQDFNNFWDSYYQQEWSTEQRINKIKEFGLAFRQEVLELGFDSVSNPFIAFLKGGQNSARIDTFNFTKSNYTVLHNMYVREKLNANDLRGTGVFKDANLIFNQWIYKNKTAIEFEEYLNCQHKFQSRAKSDFPKKEAAWMSDNPVLANRNIMLEKGNLDDWSNSNVPQMAGESVVRPITQLKQKFAQLNGVWTTKDRASMVRIKNYFKSKSSDEARDILIYLLAWFDQNNLSKAVSAVQSKYSSIAALANAPAPNQKKTKSYLDSLDLQKTSFDEQAAIDTLKIAAVKAHLIPEAELAKQDQQS